MDTPHFFLNNFFLADGLLESFFLSDDTDDA